jgi:hypothetical protein
VLGVRFASRLHAPSIAEIGVARNLGGDKTQEGERVPVGNGGGATALGVGAKPRR